MSALPGFSIRFGPGVYKQEDVYQGMCQLFQSRADVEADIQPAQADPVSRDIVPVQAPCVTSLICLTLFHSIRRNNNYIISSSSSTSINTKAPVGSAWFSWEPSSSKSRGYFEQPHPIVDVLRATGTCVKGCGTINLVCGDWMAQLASVQQYCQDTSCFAIFPTKAELYYLGQFDMVVNEWATFAAELAIVLSDEQVYCSKSVSEMVHVIINAVSNCKQHFSHAVLNDTKPVLVTPDGIAHHYSDEGSIWHRLSTPAAAATVDEEVMECVKQMETGSCDLVVTECVSANTMCSSSPVAECMNDVVQVRTTMPHVVSACLYECVTCAFIHSAIVLCRYSD